MQTNHNYAWIWLLGTLVTTACQTDRISDLDVVSIDYQALLELLNDPKGKAMLVDVRMAPAFESGHISGAINIPIHKLQEEEEQLAEAKSVIVYSQNTRDLLSRAAFKTLLRRGYKNVHNFQGGLDLWRLKAKRENE